ncbi:MAG: 1-acyl-sn-glycerol-3-phosphate acyltransferase [Alphaproteobacteria bacterium]|nr:1-acyl-sn-glycerol-3-phosphate acyltransferase [Alphaproteobacteria bacterium]
MRAHLFHVVVVLSSLLMFIVIILPVLVAPRVYRRKICLLWVAYFCWLYRRMLNLEVEWRGLSCLPLTEPHLILLNHQSALETIEMMRVFSHSGVVMKRELTRVIFLGWLLSLYDVIAIDRTRSTASLRKMLRRAAEFVARGESVILFPEGSRMPLGAPVRFRSGFALLHNHLALPVLPIVVNTGVFLPKHGVRRYGGRVILEVLPAYPAGVPVRRAQADLEQLMDKHKALLEAEGFASLRK